MAGLIRRDVSTVSRELKRNARPFHGDYLARGETDSPHRARKENTIVYDEMKAMGEERWSRESAISKVVRTDTAMKVAVDCVQMCGGIGYMRDFPIEKFMRDPEIMQIHEGTNQGQRNEIAACMIRKSAQENPI